MAEAKMPNSRFQNGSPQANGWCHNVYTHFSYRVYGIMNMMHSLDLTISEMVEQWWMLSIYVIISSKAPDNDTFWKE